MEDRLEQYAPMAVIFLGVLLLQGLDHLLVWSGGTSCLACIVTGLSVPVVLQVTREQGLSQREKQILLLGHTVICLAISVVLGCLRFSWAYILFNGLNLWLVLLGAFFQYEAGFQRKPRVHISNFVFLLCGLALLNWQWSMECLLLLCLPCFALYAGCNYFVLKKLQ